MKYNKKILKNGLRIITVPMQDNNTVTALVLVEAGSKYENEKNNGISHFLEHMCFKGTDNRPNPGDISHELDALGAQSNAFTSQEFTGYYAKAHTKQTHKLIDIISDLYLNPIFNDAEIEKEKGVIIEEMNMYKDLPMRDIHDVFMRLLYGDSPTGRNIVGTKEIIKCVIKKDFEDYRKNHYVASATTVVVSGKFDEKKVIKDIEERFKNVSVEKHHKKEKVKENQKAPQIAIKNKKLDQSHLILGVRAFDLFKKDSAVVSVIAGILGKGMSSRLFFKLREEMGVCYYVRAGNNAFTDHGFFNISAGVDNSRVEEVVGVLLEEMRKLKKDLVSNFELKKVKEYMTGSLFLGLESSDDLAEYYGIQEILNQEIKKPKEKAKRIREITAQDIKRVANKIFKNESLNLAVVGPIDDKKKEEIKKMFGI
ncbi:insulinase family protein [Patescibacteria group bacterium]|nr:insulinase family protein [Patescibacteria group bacterium]MCG2695012.1 insulinase family protein [Candidatus Parcubacteria bacterium]